MRMMNISPSGGPLGVVPGHKNKFLVESNYEPIFCLKVRLYRGNLGPKSLSAG